MMVKDREPCVCQIVEILEYAPSTVSKHLSILKEAGLIDSYKKGRWVYYKKPDNPSRVVSDALQWVMSHLEESAQITKDRLKCISVCEQDPVEIAKIQRNR